MKKRNAVIFVVSLTIALLLAGLCSCKQETAPEITISEGEETATLNAGISGVVIPKWEKDTSGLQDLPEILLSGTETGVTKALKAALLNPPKLKKANNLIVMVCEDMTSDLIEESARKYGELILKSFPIKGFTESDFNSPEDDLLVDYILNDLEKDPTGIVAFGSTATNSMRRMTTDKNNDATERAVCDDQFKLNPPLKFVMGQGTFDESFDEGSAGYINEVYKSSGKMVKTLAEAVSLYRNENVHFEYGDLQHDGSVAKLYTVFENDDTLPSFRQEVAFSLAWIQDKMDEDGFCLLMTYSPSAALDGNGIQDFDEGVVVAAKYALENPDTAILVLGCPSDGSKSQVCFYGFGQGVSVRETIFECVSSIFKK